MEASITLNSIGKRFNNSTLLAALSFGVEKNTTFALIGSNSSGKSTIYVQQKRRQNFCDIFHFLTAK